MAGLFALLGYGGARLLDNKNGAMINSLLIASFSYKLVILLPLVISNISSTSLFTYDSGPWHLS